MIWLILIALLLTSCGDYLSSGDHDSPECGPCGNSDDCAPGLFCASVGDRGVCMRQFGTHCP